MSRSATNRAFSRYILLLFTSLSLILILLLHHTIAQQNTVQQQTQTSNIDPLGTSDVLRMISDLLDNDQKLAALKRSLLSNTEPDPTTTTSTKSKTHTDTRSSSNHHSTPFSTLFHTSPLNRRRLLYNLSTNSTSHSHTEPFPPMTPDHISRNKALLLDMFRHAYDGYMYNAFPSSELRPLSCTPGRFDLVRLPALTLIDTLDTLLVMSNETEFARSVERLRFHHVSAVGEGGLFDVDENVSVFETNIRVLGGLISAHQLVLKVLPVVYLDDVLMEDGVVKIGGVVVEDRRSEVLWEYDGFLLELAVDIGDRLMPAFASTTGIPFGTVHLQKGVPKGETTVASLAGGGTLTLEFEMLTRLTGDVKYGNAAMLATRALFLRRDPHTNLLGKHIDIQTGSWKEARSGIGTNSDSFYEYLLKFYILFQKDDFWAMFQEVYKGVWKYVRTNEHWFGDVEMHRANVHAKTHVFESLAAFWPGLLVLLGELAPAKTLLNAIFLAREELGFLPERFSYQNFKMDSNLHNEQQNTGSGGNHPLRPELIESTYFLHRATKEEKETSSWLWPADFSLHALERLTKTECGYASVRRVTPRHSNQNYSNIEDYYNPDSMDFEDEMPSYFLSETIKYLYLLFDDDNILHQETDHPWIFTTEAHPLHFLPDPRVTATPTEKWTSATRARAYYNAINQIQLGDASTPPAQFNLSQLLTRDQLQFHPLGVGETIAQHCPNYNHPRFGWVHALGLDGGLNYEEDYAQRMVKNSVAKSEPPEGVCEAPVQRKVTSGGSQTNNRGTGPNLVLDGSVEPVQLDMGEGLGVVEVAMMTDGFYARHLRSDETIEVSLVTVPLSQSTDPEKGLIQTYLLIMTRRPGDLIGSDPVKRVIFADWQGNRFVCHVDVYKTYPRSEDEDDDDDDIKEIKSETEDEDNEEDDDDYNPYHRVKIRDFPCSPAMYGPSVMRNLVAKGGLRRKGVVVSPNPENKHACNLNGNDPSSNESSDPTVQLIWRGKCSFEDKSKNIHGNIEHDAVIVVNDESDHLFVMASSASPLSYPQSMASSAEEFTTPVSVLVGRSDGQKMIQLVTDKNRHEGRVEAVVRMEPNDADWPKVTTTKGALQILAFNGWGIHVEYPDSSDKDMTNWQLFVVSHGLDETDEEIKKENDEKKEDNDESDPITNEE